MFIDNANKLVIKELFLFFINLWPIQLIPYNHILQISFYSSTLNLFSVMWLIFIFES